MPDPVISIVVPVCNEAEKTIQCFKSVKAYTDIPYELVWVDNGSRKEHYRKIHDQFMNSEMNIKLVQFDTNRGFVKATNAGIQATTPSSRYVVLLNNDTIVTPAWVNKLIAPFQDKKVGAVGPITQSKMAWQEPENLNRRWNLGLPLFAEPRKIDHKSMELYNKVLSEKFENKYVESHGLPLSFFCVAMRKATIEKVGLLDEVFGYGLGDDDEYCFRLRAYGYTLLVSLGTFVYHWHRTTFKSLKLPIDQIRRQNLKALERRKKQITEKLQKEQAQAQH